MCWTDGPTDHSQSPLSTVGLRSHQRCTSFGRATIGTAWRHNPNLDKFAAFISYRTQHDHELARELQHVLERQVRAWYQARSVRVFRDQSNLAAGADAWERIRTELERSAWLILLARPESAESRWVRREVDWWLTNRDATSLFIVITAGEVVWDVDDFNWAVTDALPRAEMEGKTGKEPLHVTLRDLPHDPALRAERVDEAAATIGATIRGLSKDQLFGAHLREQSRTRRITQAVLAALTLLAVAAGSGAVIAAQQRNSAVAQTLVATSRQLVAESTAIRDTQPDLARQLLVQAYRMSPTSQAIGALVMSPSIPRVVHTADYSDDVAFSAGRPVFASASRAEVNLYSTAGGLAPEKLSTITGGSASPAAVAFSPDDRLLAIADADGPLRIYDVTDVRHPTQVDTLGVLDAEEIAFSAQAPLLVAMDGAEQVSVIDITKPSEARTMSTLPGSSTGGGLNSAVAISPNGRLVAAQNEDTLVLWDISTPTRPRRTATLAIPGSAAMFHPGGNVLAVGGEDDTTRLIDVSDPRAPFTIATVSGQRLGIGAVAFSSDGETLATGAGDATVALWDVTDRLRPALGTVLKGHTGSIRAVALSPDDRIVASAGADGPPESPNGSDQLNGTVRLWNVAGTRRASEAAAIDSHDGSTPAFSADGKLLAGGFPSTIWELSESGLPRDLGTVPTFNQGQYAVRFAPNRSVLVAGMPPRAWDLSDPRKPRELSPRSSESDGVSVLRFSPNGELLATSSVGSEVQLWSMTDVAAPRHLAGLPGSTAAAIAFNNDGRLLATVDTEGSVVVWDISRPGQPTQRGTIEIVDARTTAIDFATRDQVLYVGTSAGAVTSWSVQDPDRPDRRGEIARHNGAVDGLVHHPSRAMVASASDDGARLFDVSDVTRPVEVAALADGRTFSSADLAFSPDGRLLAVTGSGGLSLWDVDSDTLLRRLCAQSQPITADQWSQYLADEPYDPPCRT
ncbi:TIR domain-containing protein [Micromonospora violae]|uniref:TIR domain-containing protein n=1 Tax=Micromonospora violae TaxID=1278207 RepID=UPI002448638C|nr:TIR domain-containing protein [Micromonospora violae]